MTRVLETVGPGHAKEEQQEAAQKAEQERKKSRNRSKRRNRRQEKQATLIRHLGPHRMARRPKRHNLQSHKEHMNVNK